MELFGLVFLMAAVTYPSRAVPMLAPGIERLPGKALLYLRLVGPAVLASLAAANTFVRETPQGTQEFYVGIEAVGVVACLADRRVAEEPAARAGRRHRRRRRRARR